MFIAAFSILFCISAVADGGPATLTTLVLATAGAQLVVSKWLFILRTNHHAGGSGHGDDGPVDHAGIGGLRYAGPGIDH